MKRQRHQDRVAGVNQRIRERSRPKTIVTPSGMIMTTEPYFKGDLRDLCNPIKNAAAAQMLQLREEGGPLEVTGWGSTFSLDPERGWLVDGEPYNPDEDGVHQPAS